MKAANNATMTASTAMAIIAPSEIFDCDELLDGGVVDELEPTPVVVWLAAPPVTEVPPEMVAAADPVA
jgi:hypothetical protein